MSDEVFEKLKKFIIEQRWEYDFPILRETTLERDLRITGDDADEFLIAFSKEFNVDVSEFPIGDYFGSEGDQILPAIIRLLTKKEKKQKKSLTVGQLEMAAIAGKLNEEVIGS